MTKLFVIALLAAGCQIEVEVQEVRLSYDDVAIDAVPGRVGAEHQFVFDDLAALRDLVESGAEITLLGTELRADDPDALSFVDELRITVASGDPDSTLEPLTAFECRNTCKSEDRKLALPAASKRSASDYVRGGSLLIDLALVGQMPGRAWMLDFDVVLEARLDYTYEP